MEQGKKDRVEEIIQDMEDSQVVMIAHHSNDPSVGMPLHEDSDRYKMYLNDTGLFITLAFKDKDITENIIYQKLLNDKLAAATFFRPTSIMPNEMSAPTIWSGRSFLYMEIAKSPVPVAISSIVLGEKGRRKAIPFLRHILSIPNERVWLS